MYFTTKEITCSYSLSDFTLESCVFVFCLIFPVFSSCPFSLALWLGIGCGIQVSFAWVCPGVISAAATSARGMGYGCLLAVGRETV